MKEYSKLPYAELRRMCIDGKLAHEYMAEEDYDLLIDFECQLDSPDKAVVDFCYIGLKELDILEEYGDFFKQAKGETTESDCGEPPQHDYGKMPCEDLRKLLLDGKLEHKYMSESIYERLFDHESHFPAPNPAVIAFCSAGLRRVDKYKDYSDIEIYMSVLGERKKRQIIEQEVLNAFYKPKRTVPVIGFFRFIFKYPRLAVRGAGELYGIFYRKHKRFAVVGIVILSSTLLITTAAAFGFNILELARNAISNPNNITSDEDGRDAIFSDDVRVYDSISAMLETEKFSILYPAELPIGYEFTDFMVIAIATDLEIQMFASEPYISFVVLIGAENQVENNIGEINGIRYNITEMEDGLYVAEWNHNGDYYTIVVSDTAILSEIIENLKES
jgi:hypothetical protein